MSPQRYLCGTAVAVVGGSEEEDIRLVLDLEMNSKL